MISKKSLKRYIDKQISEALKRRNIIVKDSFEETAISVIGRLLKNALHGLIRSEKEHPDTGMFTQWKIKDIKQATKSLGDAYSKIKTGDDPSFDIRFANMILSEPDDYKRRLSRWGSEGQYIVSNMQKAKALMAKLMKAMDVQRNERLI